MTEPTNPGISWTLLKILGLVVGLIGMGSFGLCSLVGAFTVVTSGDVGLLIFVIIGALLTAGSAALVTKMVRSLRKSKPRS